MKVIVLDIEEFRFIIENGKKVEWRNRHVTTWADKEDAFSALIEWINAQNHALDKEIIYLANAVALDNQTQLGDKIAHVLFLLNRFSKVAAELNLKAKYSNNKDGTTWAHVSMFETKLRGNAFE